jgi:hypothetical protein
MFKPELRFTANDRNPFPIYICSCFSLIASNAEGFICRNLGIRLNHKEETNLSKHSIAKYVIKYVSK